MWGAQGEDYGQLPSAWQQISAPAFYFLTCRWLHMRWLLWNLISVKGKNEHFIEKCSFRCMFRDQINLLNRFFVLLIGVWVNVMSSWHRSFREKSDSGLMNMLFLSFTSKLRPIHQPGKSAVIWVLWYELIDSSSTSFLLFATCSPRP